VILYLPVLLYLIVVPQINDGLELPRSIVLILFCLAYLVAKPNKLIVNNKFILLPLLIPLIYIVNIFLNEQNIYQALFGGYKRNFGIITHIAIALIYIISINSKNIDSNLLFKKSLFPLIGLSLIYSIIQITGNDFLIWSETDRVLLTLGNSNFAAVYLAILLPGCIFGLTRKSNSALLKSTFFLLFILLINIGMQTKSFQFRVLALTVILVYFLIYYYENLLKIPIKLRAISFGLVMFLIGGLIYQYRNLLNNYTSADDRLSTQIIGLKMFKDNFLTGVGVENFYSFAQLYIKPEDVRREGADRFLDKSHNSFIDHFANGGFFVGIVYFLFLFSIFFFLYRLLKINYKLKEELPLLGSIFICYITQLFFNTDSILIMIVPYIVMGIITKLYFEAFKHNSGLKHTSSNSLLLKIDIKYYLRFIRIISLILFIVITSLGQKIIQTDYEYKQILVGQVSNGNQIMNTLYQWPYVRPMEQVMVKFAQNLENCIFLEGITDRILSVDSRSSEAWFVKAVCADSQGKRELALKYTEESLNLHPLNIRYLNAKYQLEKSLELDLEAKATLKLIELIGVTDGMQ
jgi:hypothetical protein